MSSQIAPVPSASLGGTGAHVIHIKRKRKDPPIDSLYLEQHVEYEPRLESLGLAKPKAPSRKLRRTQFMYQRINPEEIALFDAPPADASTFLPEPPAPAVLAKHHQSGLIESIAGSENTAAHIRGDQGEAQVLPKRKRLLPRRWEAAPILGKDGERTFVLEKRGYAEKDVDLNDGSQGLSTSQKETVSDEDVLEDYVWDVLIRTNVKDANSTLGAGVLAIPVAGINTGRLIVNKTDEEELFGDLYQSDGEDEDRVETDDEDENAEDYYGADYPEEEDNEDDDEDDDEDDEEYGDNNYYYNSDDEEFGGSGAGYYNEETGRFSKTKYLNTYNDEVRSMRH